MAFHDPATTYAEALDNLTEENWHTERALIEAEVARKPIARWACFTTAELVALESALSHEESVIVDDLRGQVLDEIGRRDADDEVGYHPRSPEASRMRAARA